MKKFNSILLVIVLVVALMAVEIVIVRSLSNYEPGFNIVHARIDIEEGTIITAEMLEEKHMNISMIHKQASRNISELEGKRAKSDIVAGEAILSSRVGEDDEMEGIPVNNMNNRLYTVEFRPDQANGWWLKVDQYVDLIFVPNTQLDRVLPSQPPEEGDYSREMAALSTTKEYSYAGIIRISNVRIAALIDDKGQLLGNGERSTLPKYACFEVTKEQDEFLAYAKGNGRIEMSCIP